MMVSRTLRIVPPLASLLISLTLAACNQDTPAAETPIRPVKTQVVQITELKSPESAIGEIKPRYEADIGFRIAGKIATRPVDVGSVLKKGDLIATLDSTIERTAVSIAESDVKAAQADLAEALAQQGRAQELLERGAGTQSNFDAAERRSKMAQARVDSLNLARNDAAERLGYAELRSDDAGVVTAVGSQPGQVVAAGQMVVHVARTDVKEAEFKVSERALQSVPQDAIIQVTLLSDPAVKTQGHVREVATTADPVSRTYAVRISLNDPPEAMRFGATVQGQVILTEKGVIELPSSALFESDKKPAVWVFDPATSSVSLRRITILRYEADLVLVSGGLNEGERVVTAGVQKLWPGMKVRLL